MAIQRYWGIFGDYNDLLREISNTHPDWGDDQYDSCS